MWPGMTGIKYRTILSLFSLAIIYSKRISIHVLSPTTTSLLPSTFITDTRLLRVLHATIEYSIIENFRLTIFVCDVFLLPSGLRINY